MITVLKYAAASCTVAMAIAIVALGLSRPAKAQMPCRVIEVHDADSIRCSDGTRLRLWGIDAPELDQPYGQEAAAEVRATILGQDIECLHMGFDRFYRILARCDHGGYDLNEWIVASGLAWCFERYSRAYCDAQATAKRDEQGLWARRNHTPIPPWQWRAERRNGR